MHTQTDRPLVSIGVPASNGEATLERALDSVLAQTYEHLEIVVCDDASEDRTEDICRRYAARDRRIRYYRNTRPVGRLRHYWSTVELASGEFFMWADQWDEKPKQTVELCVAALQNEPKAVLAYGAVLEKAPHLRTPVEIEQSLPMQGLIPHERISLLVRELRSIMIMYGLFRRTVLQKAIYADHYGPDVLLLLQVCCLGPFVEISSPIVIFQTRQVFLEHTIMYSEVPLTIKNLLKAGRHVRQKCWSVLFWGIWYMWKVPGLGRNTKGRTIVSYTKSYIRKYKILLLKEAIFQVSWPFAWLASRAWDVWKRVVHIEGEQDSEAQVTVRPGQLLEDLEASEVRRKSSRRKYN